MKFLGIVNVTILFKFYFNDHLPELAIKFKDSHHTFF